MDWRENDRKVNNRRAFSERSRGQTRTVRQARFVSVWARAGRTLDTCNNVQINPAPWWCSRASDQHTDPVVADHSSGPTDRWNIPLKLQVNPSFLWFFSSSASSEGKHQPANGPANLHLRRKWSEKSGNSERLQSLFQYPQLVLSFYY